MPDSLPSPNEPSPKLNVLLVDDQPANLLALEAILEGLGARLVQAASGYDALRYLLADEYAIVLLDVRMPGLDGYETANLIRKRAKSKHTPIIFLTAHENSDEDVVRAYALGAVDFLFKPFLPAILRAKVTGLLDLCRKTEQIKRQEEQIRLLQRREFEVKLAEENRRLRESEARKAAVLETAFDGIVALDPNGLVVEFNPAAELALGRRRAEVVGRSFVELMTSPSGNGDGKHPFGTAEELVRRRRLEVQTVREDGTAVPLELAVTRAIDGCNPLITVYVRDLSERKRREAALEERIRLAKLEQEVGIALTRGDLPADMLRHCAEALVRNLEGAFARIWTLHETDDVLELQASAGLYTHTNGPHGRVPVGKYKIGLIAQERKPHLTNAVVGDPRVGDQEWARREGMVAFAGYPLLIDDGLVGVMAMFARKPFSEAVLQGMASVASGIALGIRRKRTEAALRESEANFRQLAEAMPPIVWVGRPDGGHEYYNRRWHEYTGLTPEESLGFGWRTALHPDDRQMSIDLWALACRTGERYELECRFRNRDGDFRWFLGQALPVRDEAGRAVRWFGACTDIDDRKKAEAALRQARAELEDRVRERTADLASTNAALLRSNRELEQFAYVASHDLQEPLRKIQAFGDRLVTRYADRLDDNGKDYLARMQSAAGRMRTLIDDLLTFSRVATRNEPFHAAVDLTRLAEEVVSDLEGRIQQTGGRVEIGALPTLEADPTQMRQLLQNLIANGLKFHRAGVPPVVQVEARDPIELADPPPDLRSGPWCEITVRDNGIGFDEAYRERIFQIFQRLHGRNEYEGTGIGLAVCRKIVERHGGVLQASATPGEGAVFVVILPVRQSSGERP